MKKSLIIILAVAIIGGLGVYTKSHNSSSASANDQSSGTGASSDNNATAVSSSPTASSSATSSASGGYKDGTFYGKTISTVYGDVRIAAVISGGKIVDVKFVEMPDDLGNSRQISNESEGPLKQSAIAKQSAHIDFVSGATQTSQAYETSLQSALDQAG